MPYCQFRVFFQTGKGSKIAPKLLTFSVHNFCFMTYFCIYVKKTPLFLRNSTCKKDTFDISNCKFPNKHTERHHFTYNLYDKFSLIVIPSVLLSFLPNIVILSELFRELQILTSSKSFPYPKGEKNGHWRWPYMRVIVKKQTHPSWSILSLILSSSPAPHFGILPLSTTLSA